MTDWEEPPWMEGEEAWPKSPRRRTKSRTQSPRKRSTSARMRTSAHAWDPNQDAKGGKGQEKGKQVEKGPGHLHLDICRHPHSG